MADLALVDRQTGEILDATPTWDDFWLLYPRRVAKKDALRAWVRLRPWQQVAAVTALVQWRRVWASKELEYLPHPATWLNGERWDDELPPEYSATSAAHVAAVLPEVQARTTMPEFVKQAIARLRGK